MRKDFVNGGPTVSAYCAPLEWDLGATLTSSEGPNFQQMASAARPNDTILMKYRWRMTIVWVLVFLIVAIGVLQNGHVTSLDSGVFLTAGQRMNQGDLLYLDIWDHKPPGIHVVNSLALRMFPGAVIGPHLFEGLAILVSTVILFLVLRSYFGTTAAFLGAVGLALFLPLRLIAVGGNRPETFEVLWISFVYGLVLGKGPTRGLKHSKRTVWIGVVSGLSIGLASLFKPTALLHVFSVVFLVVLAGYGNIEAAVSRRIKTAVVVTGCLATGILLVHLPVLYLIGSTGAGGEYLWQAYGYNFLYAQSLPLGEYILNLRQLVYSVWPQLFPLIVLVPVALIRHLPRGSSKHIPVTGFTAWAIVEAFAVALPGRFFPYYLITLIPPLVLMAAIAAADIVCEIGGESLLSSTNSSLRNFAAIALLASMVIPIFSQLLGIGNVAKVLLGENPFSRTTADPLAREIAGVLRGASDSDDAVFVWGAAPELYFLSNRKPASRFIYVFPILGSFGGMRRQGYPLFHLLEEEQDAYISQLQSDLDEATPQLIAVEPRFRDRIDELHYLDRLISEEYELKSTIDGWQIYEERR